MTDPIDHEMAVMAEQVTARGVHGVVCAAAPLAAQAGAATMADGGNAFDAVVAAALAETVLLPPKCGLGGDLVAICLSAGAPAPEALVAVGGAPQRLAAHVEAHGLDDVGPMSVGPPGAPAGYAELAARGRFGRARLAAPAIRLALDGFAWSKVCAELAVQARQLVERMNPDGCSYFPGGAAISPGSVVRLPGLAGALDDWVERGADLVHGPVGQAIVAAVAARGGTLTLDDMVHARAAWQPCASGSLGARRVWTTPAPTHGPALLEVAARLYPSVPADQVYRLVIEAIGRRRDQLADPSGTSIVSAGDAEGNVAVVVHSNSYPRFGSGIVEPSYQIVLANRAGRGFTATPGHPNFPVAGRRPATTLHAWMVSDADGVPELAGGTPGGENQMPWNAQALARIVRGWTEPGRLVSAPLWEWLPADDGVRLEGGLDPADDAALRRCAPRVLSAPRWGCRSAQQVVRVGGGRPWEAAADPRTVGLALGT